MAPKPIIRKTEISGTDIRLELATGKDLSADQKLRLDRLLRKPRSKGYIEAVRSLDAGGHTANRRQVEEMIERIRSEFPEIEISGILLGFVAKCWLGPGYEVHSLDMTGEIIDHFRTGQKLSGGLEKARGIAMRGGYEFIEVYSDCLRAVRADGTVSVIGG